MRLRRSLLLLLLLIGAALFQSAVLAAGAQPAAAVGGASALSSAGCADMSGDCDKCCPSCDGAMPACQAVAGCGTAAALEPAPGISAGDNQHAPADICLTSAAFHSRSVKPEIHPPILGSDT